MASTLKLFRHGAVGFIDWLGLLNFDGTIIVELRLSCKVNANVADR